MASLAPPEYDAEKQSSGPQSLKRQHSGQTRYVEMLLALDTVPRAHNILAAVSTWIVLAGFVIFPGTFTSLRTTKAVLEASDDSNVAEKAILGAVRNVPLLWLAVGCCAGGTLSMGILWLRWRKNYIWLLNKIFLPGALNSLAGLMSTLINVYTAQQHSFSLIAIVSTAVTATSLLVTTIMFILYNNWALEKVRQTHHQETAAERKAREIAEEGF